MFTLNNNRNSKFEIVFTVALTVIAILTLGMAKFSAMSAADHSYDAVEQIHAVRSFAPASGLTNYDAIENLRIARALSPVASSYDLLEQLRTARGLSADRSYDSLEQVRLSNAFSVSTSGYDMLEQLRLARGTQDAYASIEALRLTR